ncbi:Cytochrome P450 2J6 [Halotydeus destructor]|nr:Cytochrome P450 2J6 [Halotydeus destructor]
MDTLFSDQEICVALLVATVGLVTSLHTWLQDKAKWPKGPKGWPLLGYVPYLGRFSFETFHKLQEQFGPIFTVQIFTSKLIVVNGLQPIKEIFSRDELLGRPEPGFLWSLGEPESLVDGSGDTWKEQRRFAVHHLRDHGFGKSKMEELIREEIGYLTREIEKQSDELVDILKVLTPSIMNNIFIFLVGKRFDYDDPKRTPMDNALSVFPEFLKSTGFMLNFPKIAKYLFKYNLFGFGKAPQAYRNMCELLKAEIEEHRASLDTNCPRDYIDSFLIEHLRRQQAGEDTGRFNGMLSLTSEYPDVQSKVRAELDEIFGDDGAPTWADRVRLPYTMAVLMEAQRWASAVPMSLPRRVLSTVVISGVTLPEGATIIPNLWSAHHDSKVWNQPNEFNPLNFYDETTGTVINRDLLIPFSHVVNFRCHSGFTFEMDKSWSNYSAYVAPLVVSVILVKSAHSWFQARKEWPKGPWGVPIVGYVPFIGQFPFETFHGLQEQYGPIFTVNLFTSKLVIVNGLEAIKEVLSKDEVLGRPVPTFMSPLGAPENVADGSGELWKEQRRFALHHLRDHGFGKSKMEDKIREEIGFLTKEIEKHSKDPVDIFKIMTPSVSNNICILIFGRRFDYDDPKRITMDQALSVVPQFLTPAGLLMTFPRLAAFNFKYSLFGWGKLHQAFDAISELVKNEVAEHEATLDSDNPRDYIDSFLIEQRKLLEAGKEVGNFNFDLLVANTRAFFGAGSETVRTTVVWSLMLMVKYQDVQSKVQAELDDIVGTDRAPSWDDRLRLPYTMAALMEVQRWASVVPLSVPRRVLSPVVVNGVTLPEGALVLPNLWSAHHDSKVWSEPHAFNPLNFYDDTSNTVINKDMLIPFSIGKRNCVGESLAQVELFLYFATILQKFTIDQSPLTPLSFEKILGIALQPATKPNLKFTLRK